MLFNYINCLSVYFNINITMFLFQNILNIKYYLCDKLSLLNDCVLCIDYIPLNDYILCIVSENDFHLQINILYWVVHSSSQCFVWILHKYTVIHTVLLGLHKNSALLRLLFKILLSVCIGSSGIVVRTLASKLAYYGFKSISG